MRDIKFTHTGHSNALGNFSAGQEALGLSDELAKHFVEEAGCAEYMGDAPAPAEVKQTEQTDKPRRKGTK